MITRRDFELYDELAKSADPVVAAAAKKKLGELNAALAKARVAYIKSGDAAPGGPRLGPRTAAGKSLKGRGQRYVRSVRDGRDVVVKVG
jgi:hypothetical protein